MRKINNLEYPLFLVGKSGEIEYSWYCTEQFIKVTLSHKQNSRYLEYPYPTKEQYL